MRAVKLGSASLLKLNEDSVIVYHVDKNMGSEVCALLVSAHLSFTGIEGDVVEWRDIFARRVFCGKSVIHLFSTHVNLKVR